MAVCGVYTKAQQKMVDDTNKLAESLVGWDNSSNKMVATEESIIKWGNISSYEDPLWRDDNYARGTRWGSIVAFPGYTERFGAGRFSPEMTAAVGFPDFTYIGDDWEFFKPVRPGDTFKVWRKRPFLEDITTTDGKGSLTFRCLVNDLYHINQNDELVDNFKRYMQCVFHEKKPEKVESMPESKYKYTKEELEYIEHIRDEEEVRGAKIRYWEDVNVGEEPKAVVLGPITVSDEVGFSIGRGDNNFLNHIMVKRLPGDIMADPEAGFNKFGTVHHSDDDARMWGRPQAFIFGPQARGVMVRFVTNWMGDDGFLRKFKFRHIAQTPIGDTLIGRGKVINKRIENGEYLVDIKSWLEDIRGYITEVSTATVSLYSKEVPMAWEVIK